MYATIVALLLGSFGAMAQEEEDDAPPPASPKIAHVFLAQHHVQTPTNALFKLVGAVDVLVKVQVNGTPGSPSPDVWAGLVLGAKSQTLSLKGPAVLPAPSPANPLLVEHRYEDSFTAIIPKEWVAPGLQVTVELREDAAAGKGALLDQAAFDKLAIGAPSRLVMTMFDIHYFGRDKDGDYPPGWFEGLRARLPVVELELRRVRHILFDTIVQKPQLGQPAIRCSSAAEYKRKTGMNYDGEQGQALRWIRALKEAAGAGGPRRLYYLNIYGVPSGGQAWGFSGVGSGRRVGILLHELGHAIGGLPDLYVKALLRYPYVGPLPDYPAPGDKPQVPHVGPTWGFDPLTGEFLPSVFNGTHRHDPMGGGGENRDGGPGGMYRFFSDHHFRRIRDRLEATQMRWDEQTGAYSAWEQATGMYSRPAGKQGDAGFPVEDNIEVVSILASASLVTTEANIVYPPIGPYVAGRAEVFDAGLPAALAKARQAGFTDANCHVCLRVTQGGKTRTYLVKDGLDPKTEPTNPGSLAMFAINLPARDGAVTKVELLDTPSVISKGLGPDAKAVSSWAVATGL